MKACLVVYDIPSKAKCKLPGSVFRPIGIRINLSCWVVPHQLVPWDYLEEIRGYGATTEVVRFDEDEAKKIRNLAHDALRKEISDIYDSFATSLKRAETWVPAAEAGVDPEEKRELKVKIILQKAKRHLRYAQEAALAFDLLADVEELLKGRKEAIAAEYDAFFAKAQSVTAVAVKKARKKKD